MALTTPSFTTAQDLSNPNLITFTDSSTGVDATITTRYIFVQLADGTYLVPAGTTTNYIVWDYANANKVVDLLSKSQAVTVTVNWYANVNNAPVYTIVQNTEWGLFDYLYLFEMLQTQTSNPSIINSSDFYDNTLKMIVNLFQAENSITKMSDVYSSQAAFDRNLYLMRFQNQFA